MTTQISFTAESDLKEKALEKAKKEGLSLKTVLIYSMKAFVDDKLQFGIQEKAEPDVDEIVFADKAILANASKIAKFLK